MEVNITNISKQFIEFWDIACDLEYSKQKKLWYDSYQKPHEDVFIHLESILKSWDENFLISNVLENCFINYRNRYDTIILLNDKVTNEIESICDKCSQLFKITDIKLNFMVMVGIFVANAMVTPYNDKTAFFFLEKISSYKELRILLAHEITHLFVNNDDISFAYMIFNEGLACYTSSILFPDLPLGDYIYVSQDRIKDYLNQFKKIKNEIIYNLDNEDYKLKKKYFIGDNSYINGLPTRLGYLIGFYLLEYLNKRYPLYELVNWKHKKIIQEVEDALIKIL